VERAAAPGVGGSPQARNALDTGKVNLVLVWVRQNDEAH